MMKDKPGYKKLIGCCDQAVEDGYEYVWIDTCCIDKSSSAELSEAINSMYGWYERSGVCYAYLGDVEDEGHFDEEAMELDGNAMNEENLTQRNLVANHIRGSSPPTFPRKDWLKSEWFRRGWTLQELIAPKSVNFYSREWTFINTKSDMADRISKTTNIDMEVLRNEPCKPANVARKMSWAAGRKTTRVEDRAYSLMGLFGVNMPMLYGEGVKAFVRLQEEIMRSTHDHSIFVWTASSYSTSLLAPSPDNFADSKDVISVDYNEYASWFGYSQSSPDYHLTNYGLQVQLPLKFDIVNNEFEAYLACTERGFSIFEPIRWIQIQLKALPGAAVLTYQRVHTAGSFGYGRERQQVSPFRDIYIVRNTVPVLETKMPYFPGIQVQVTLHSAPQNSRGPIDFFPGTGEYHDGTALRKQQSSSFTIRFRDYLENRILVIYTGSIRQLRRRTRGPPIYHHIFAVLGFAGRGLWTNIYVRKSMSHQDDMSEVTISVYNHFRERMESIGIDPSQHNMETTRAIFEGREAAEVAKYDGGRPTPSIHVESIEDTQGIADHFYRAYLKFDWK